MPMMKPPPGFNGVEYNGVKVKPGVEINVLDADVAAHLAQGWLLTGSTTLGGTPAVLVRKPGDER